MLWLRLDCELVTEYQLTPKLQFVDSNRYFVEDVSDEIPFCLDFVTRIGSKTSYNIVQGWTIMSAVNGEVINILWNNDY